MSPPYISAFFFFNDTATTEIYTLSLHDALPIFNRIGWRCGRLPPLDDDAAFGAARHHRASRVRAQRRDRGIEVRGLIKADRKSTRLNSSHLGISYAVFCLKKKKDVETRASVTPE